MPQLWLLALLASLLLALAMTLLLPGVATAQDGPLADVDDAHRAVVHIVSFGSFRPVGATENELSGGEGSGFIVDPEGIVVTNAHVVNGGNLFQVYLDGEDEPRNAALLGVSECSDLAVLDIRGSGFPYLAWQTDAARRGQDVWALGYPNGRYRETKGEVLDAGERVDTHWSAVEDVVVHEARLRPGNSGGPLLDGDGKVLAVNYAGVTDERIYAGISADLAASVVEVLRQGQDVDSLGINGEAYWAAAYDYGIWVVAVESGSPADRAGLRPGDVLTALEALPVGYDGTMGSYCDILRSHRPGAALAFTALRGGETVAGQFNGVSLAGAAPSATQVDVEPVVQPVAEQAAASAEPAAVTPANGYHVVTGASGAVQVVVPATWTEVEERPIGLGSLSMGPLFTVAGTDDQGEHALFLILGVLFTRDGDSTGWLTNLAPTDKCQLYSRQDVYMADFTGVAEIWTECNDAPGHSALTAQLTPTWDQQITILVVVVGLEQLESLEATLAPLGSTLRAHPDFYNLPSAVIQADILNVRTGPGTEHAKIGELVLADHVFVYGKDSAACGWYYIMAGNDDGWISADPEYTGLDRSCADLEVVTPEMVQQWGNWGLGAE